MLPIKLNTALRVRYRLRDYVVKSLLPSGQLELLDPETAQSVIMSREEIVRALFSDRTLEFPSSSLHRNEQSAEPGKPFGGDLGFAPADLQEWTLRRHTYVKTCLDRGIYRSRKAIEAIIAEVSQETGDSNPPSVKTIYRAIKRYTGDVASLIPGYRLGKRRRLRVDPAALDAIEQAINELFLRMTRGTIKSVVDAVTLHLMRENDCRQTEGKALIRIPSRSTIYRIVSRLDPYEVMKSRRGKRIADKVFTIVKKAPRPSRPLERVEIDHTKTDLMVVDDEHWLPIGRAWLTSALDVYSRYYQGFYLGFDHPSSLAALHCLRHAIAPKDYVRTQYPEIRNSWDSYGMMEGIFLDNGAEFHSTSFRIACAQLGIGIEYAPPRAPTFKGAVERLFGRLNQDMLHSFHGTTFSNLFDRGDYDPRANAVISFKDLLRLIHIYIIDDYHQTFHRGIEAVPAAVWEQGIRDFPPRLPASAANLDILLGITVQRALSRKGLEYLGLRYYSSELMRLLPRKPGESRIVTFRHNPEDLSVIQVHDPLNDVFIPAICTESEYAQGLSIWQHTRIRSFYLRARDGLIKGEHLRSLLEARERIRMIVQDCWMRRKGRSYGSVVARLEGIRSPVPQLAGSADGETLPPPESSDGEVALATETEGVVVGNDAVGEARAKRHKTCQQKKRAGKTGSASGGHHGLESTSPAPGDDVKGGTDDWIPYDPTG